jgi:hypothetical protein
MIQGKVVFPDPADAMTLAATPQWAKSIVQAAWSIRLAPVSVESQASRIDQRTLHK